MTTVEWLEEELNNIKSSSTKNGEIKFLENEFNGLLQQAKTMEEEQKVYSEEEVLPSHVEETVPHMKIKKLETRQPWLCEVDGTTYVRTEIKWTDDRPNDVSWHLNEDQVEDKAYLTHEQLEKLFCENIKLNTPHQEEKLQMINFLKYVFQQDGFDYEQAYNNYENFIKKI